MNLPSRKLSDDLRGGDRRNPTRTVSPSGVRGLRGLEQHTLKADGCSKPNCEELHLDRIRGYSIGLTVHASLSRATHLFEDMWRQFINVCHFEVWSIMACFHEQRFLFLFAASLCISGVKLSSFFSRVVYLVSKMCENGNLRITNQTKVHRTKTSKRAVCSMPMKLYAEVYRCRVAWNTNGEAGPWLSIEDCGLPTKLSFAFMCYVHVPTVVGIQCKNA